MSLASIARALSGKRPFFLYAFQRGGVVTLLTSRPEAIVRTMPGFAGNLWAPASISHGRIPDSDQAFRSELEVTIPLSSLFSGQLIAAFDFTPATITIWRGFLNDPAGEVVPMFRGRVLSAQPTDEGLCILTCMTEIAALQIKGLSAVIQRPCRHVLYGRGCGLNLAGWQTPGTIASINSNGLGLRIAGLTGEDYYRGGILQWGDRFEMILTHHGDALTLADDIPQLVTAAGAGGLVVLLAPGCNLTSSDCIGRFNNFLNFGGFPWMSENPFDGRQIF